MRQTIRKSFDLKQWFYLKKVAVAQGVLDKVKAEKEAAAARERRRFQEHIKRFPAVQPSWL